MSSNKVEAVNSRLKNFLRKHHGFVYNRVWGAIEEFIYHNNNSGSESLADFKTLMRNIGSVGNDANALQNTKYHSLYRKYQEIWQ